jgi:seryl-tRNA synthetase
MKKLYLLFACATLMANTAFAQELTKAEKKRLKDELKMYEKDLAGYKAKMEDIRTTLDSNDAEIKRLKDDVAYASTKQAEQDNKIAALQVELKNAKDEALLLTGQEADGVSQEVIDKVQKSRAAASTAASGGGAAMSNEPVAGTSFKVQIGLFKVNRFFDEARYLGYEEVDGMLRYIISSFPDEATAEKFVKDVRKMGIRDAFVAKYVDGKRVYEWKKNPKYKGQAEPQTLQEALDKAK